MRIRACNTCIPYSHTPESIYDINLLYQVNFAVSPPLHYYFVGNVTEIRHSEQAKINIKFKFLPTLTVALCGSCFAFNLTACTKTRNTGTPEHRNTH